MASWTIRTVTILVCAISAVPALATDRTFDKHFSAVPGGQFTLDTDVGSVTIVGHQGREIVVHIDMVGSTDFLSRLNVKAVQTLYGIAVTGRLEHTAWLDWFGFEQRRVLYTVDVPYDCPVSIHTSGGNLEIRNLNASVHATTSGGSIAIREVRGSVYTRTSGGRIDAMHIYGTTELHTSGGSIEVTDSTGDIDVSTSGGQIHLEGVDGKVQAMTSGGSVNAEVRANRGISLATMGGSIDLQIPGNIHASIEAHTNGGRVQSLIPLSSTQIATRNELRGNIHGGGMAISLRTFGGSIHIHPLD